MTTRKGIQLLYPFEERRILNQGRFQLQWRPPYLIQPKLNGDRCRGIIEHPRCLLLSSTEEIIASVPHINQACIQQLDGICNWPDGELYVHGWTWAEINSVVSRTTNLHPRYEEMEYHIFDIQTLDSQAGRIKLINTLHVTKPLVIVPTYIAWNLEELYSIYDKFISEGYEGFVVRHIDGQYRDGRTPAAMKFKPKAHDTYTILSIYEAIDQYDQPKGMVGGFNCIDDMQSVFSVGAGKLTHPERVALWQRWLEAPETIKGKQLKIEYQTMSDAKKVPLFSRAVEIID